MNDHAQKQKVMFSGEKKQDESFITRDLFPPLYGAHFAKADSGTKNAQNIV